MLRELAIRNFAIIDDLQIAFSGGLTVLSGETGAGKSIVVNAFNLLLGSRANADLVRTGAEAAELEAFFEIGSGSRAAAIMEEQGYDPGEGLLLRRIISRSDRHRIFINGRMATIQLLNSLAANLASISGQHAHQRLLNEDRQLDILDQLGGLLPSRGEVQREYREILPLIRELRELEDPTGRRGEESELLRFQEKEISEAAPLPGEDIALEQERGRLKNGEALFQAVHGAVEALYSAEGAILGRLAALRKSIEAAGGLDPALLPRAEAVTETILRLEDLVPDLRGYLSRLQPDDRRLEEVENRIHTLQRLKRKYGGSIESVLSHFEKVKSALDRYGKREAEKERIRKKLSGLHRKLAESCSRLSEKRREAARALSEKVIGELSTLKMSPTRFDVAFSAVPAGKESESFLVSDGRMVSETGIDRTAFMIAPNVGEALKPLSTVASGGELSRVVLALKAILAKTESVETIVFDEVDAGIGGGVAEAVGRKLLALSRFHQVICITHLPQIAGFGDHHYLIAKEVNGGRTRTLIRPLSGGDRVHEIARMLGGETITRTALDHATEMLNSR
jgi:DNA repair protein RecN (Recombination protein N)